MKRKRTGPGQPIGPLIELLEQRELPSSLHGLARPAPAHTRRHSAVVQAQTSATPSANASTGSSQSPAFSLGSTQLNLQGAVSSNSSTVSQVSGAPTPHEQLRENFVAVFYGPYIIGPPRFTGDISQTYANAGGNSTAFLHGNIQLGFQTPSSASQGPSGSATLYPKSFLMTGSFIIVQISGDPSQPPNGRPTTLNWIVTSASSGAFANASGSGTIQLIYHPGNGGYLHASGWGRGNVSIIFRGTLVLDGTSNPLRINSA